MPPRPPHMYIYIYTNFRCWWNYKHLNLLNFMSQGKILRDIATGVACWLKNVNFTNKDRFLLLITQLISTVLYIVCKSFSKKYMHIVIGRSVWLSGILYGNLSILVNNLVDFIDSQGDLYRGLWKFETVIPAMSKTFMWNP